MPVQPRCADVTLPTVDSAQTSLAPLRRRWHGFLRRVSQPRLAAYHRRNSQRAQRRRHQLAAQGFHTAGPVPYGYRSVRVPVALDGHLHRGTRLVPDPRTAHVIRRIYHSYLYERLGYTGIARWLNTQDWLKPINIGTGQSRLFTPTMIRTILTNPIYTGRSSRTPTSTHEALARVPRTHQPLIDDDTFAAAQARTQSRKRAGHHRFASPDAPGAQR